MAKGVCDRQIEAGTFRLCFDYDQYNDSHVQQSVASSVRLFVRPCLQRCSLATIPSEMSNNFRCNSWTSPSRVSSNTPRSVFFHDLEPHFIDNEWNNSNRKVKYVSRSVFRTRRKRNTIHSCLVKTPIRSSAEIIGTLNRCSWRH